MLDLPNSADSTKLEPRYRGILTPEAPLIFGELWGDVESAAPAVLLICGFGGVVDQPLREVAKSFSCAGLTALLVDRPCFGLSGGEPRCELDPASDVQHFVSVVDWLKRHSEGAIGVWGTSFGAAEALLLAEAHAQIKAVVAQAPPRLIKRDPLVQKDLERTVAQDIKRRAEGQSPRTIPLVSEKPNAICAMPGVAAWEHLTKTAPASWRNQITVRSLLLCSEFDCRELLSRASIPACAIGIRNDADALSESEIPSTVEKVFFDGQHYDLYTRCLYEAASAASSFFRRQFKKKDDRRR